jgi:hypothetical protein
MTEKNYWVGGVILMVLIGIALAILIPYCSAGVNNLTLPAQVNLKIMTPTKAIENSEWFIQTYNDINMAVSNIALVDKARKNFSLTDEIRSRREVEYEGLSMNLNNMVSEYNARSTMFTRNSFKEKRLPYSFKVEWNNDIPILTID